MSESPRTITLIGAPTDVGASALGASMGPEAMRVAGVQQALEQRGANEAVGADYQYGIGLV